MGETDILINCFEFALFSNTILTIINESGICDNYVEF